MPQLDFNNKLIAIHNGMRSYKSLGLGSAVPSMAVIPLWNLLLYMHFRSECETVKLCSSSFSTEAKVHLTHGDLSPITFLSKARRLQGFLAGRLPDTILSSGNIARCSAAVPLHGFARISPSTRWEKEIKAVWLMVRDPITFHTWASVSWLILYTSASCQCSIIINYSRSVDYIILQIQPPVLLDAYST
jgi:hypothetical protein